MNCGINGNACSFCDMNAADGCTNGACSCGGLAPCGSGEQCVNGACTCNAQSCPNGCCQNGICTALSVNACDLAGPGGACYACGADSDGCTNGACTCLGGPSCPSGQHCTNSGCVCDGVTCSTCCSGNVCQPANQVTACGSGGVQCVDCNNNNWPNVATYSCNVGQCAVASCNPGWGNCGGGSGCTTNLNTDNNNCGGCGSRCPLGQGCVSGVCTCNAQTCPTSCCLNGVCQSFNAQNLNGICGINGVACVKCNGTGFPADSCTNGMCMCGNNPACNLQVANLCQTGGVCSCAGQPPCTGGKVCNGSYCQ
jgi:hypothetical protein